MSQRAMFRYTIPVDDQAHEVPLTGSPVAVAAPQVDVVEFWAERDMDGQPADRAFRVFGTGQPLPDGAVWVGTCARLDAFVWHLFEVLLPDPDAED